MGSSQTEELQRRKEKEWIETLIEKITKNFNSYSASHDS